MLITWNKCRVGYSVFISLFFLFVAVSAWNQYLEYDLYRKNEDLKTVIGIEFRPDSIVSSAKLKNGSEIGVAVLGGSEAYQSLMSRWLDFCVKLQYVNL
jgi:hypothetical protein